MTKNSKAIVTELQKSSAEMEEPAGRTTTSEILRQSDLLVEWLKTPDSKLANRHLVCLIRTKTEV